VELAQPEPGRVQDLLGGVAQQPLDVAADEPLAAAAEQPAEHHHGAPGDDVLEHRLGVAQGLLALAEQDGGALQLPAQLAEDVAAGHGRRQRLATGQPLGVAL
jgi:hypothetical protein